ncbi:hypothetical protein TorRG33x02_156290, partial [Trema orientale]
MEAKTKLCDGFQKFRGLWLKIWGSNFTPNTILFLASISSEGGSTTSLVLELRRQRYHFSRSWKRGVRGEREVSSKELGIEEK